jgi:hypothetical protein
MTGKSIGLERIVSLKRTGGSGAEEETEEDADNQAKAESKADNAGEKRDRQDRGDKGCTKSGIGARSSEEVNGKHTEDWTNDQTEDDHAFSFKARCAPF